MKASAATTEWLHGYYAAIDGGRYHEVAAYLHEDCRSVYATGRVDVGRERIVARMETALGLLERIRHELKNAWEDDGEVIFELEVSYWRRDGETSSRPGMGIFVLQDGLIREQRLFVNDAGVWPRRPGALAR